MHVTRKFPLDPLRRVRADQVEAGSTAFSNALSRVERAAAERKKRESAAAEFDARAKREKDAEQRSLEEGKLFVSDLVEGASWGKALAATGRELAARTAKAKDEEKRARDGAEQARAELARAQTDKELVERRHDAWQKEKERAAIAKEEEAALEVHGARRKRETKP